MYLAMWLKDCGFIVTVGDKLPTTLIGEYYPLEEKIWIHNTHLGAILATIKEEQYLNIRGYDNFIIQSDTFEEAVKNVIRGIFREIE